VNQREKELEILQIIRLSALESVELWYFCCKLLPVLTKFHVLLWAATAFLFKWDLQKLIIVLLP
jgi:hypothetical protein